MRAMAQLAMLAARATSLSDDSRTETTEPAAQQTIDHKDVDHTQQRGSGSTAGREATYIASQSNYVGYVLGFAAVGWSVPYPEISPDHFACAACSNNSGLQKAIEIQENSDDRLQFERQAAAALAR